MTGDPRHIVDLTPAEVADLREWLARPNGTHSTPRVSFDAVEGGRILVITRPYRHTPRETP